MVLNYRLCLASVLFGIFVLHSPCNCDSYSFLCKGQTESEPLVLYVICACLLWFFLYSPIVMEVEPSKDHGYLPATKLKLCKTCNSLFFHYKSSPHLLSSSFHFIVDPYYRSHYFWTSHLLLKTLHISTLWPAGNTNSSVPFPTTSSVYFSNGFETEHL